VAGPNHGSELADYLHEHYPHDSVRGRMLSSLLRWVAALMSLLETGYRGPKLPVDIHASHHSLTSAGVALFNQRYPQGLPECWGGHGPEEVNGVRYYSWSGTLQPGKTDRGAIRLMAPIAVADCSPKPSCANRVLRRDGRALQLAPEG
jgi:triacylglycerol lipase